MSTQSFTRERFWLRYGGRKFDDTTFAKALARVPAVGPNGPWIAGGAVRRLVMDLPQDSDFDFFFRNADQLAAFKTYLEARGAFKVNERDTALTYKLPSSAGKPELLIQLIRVAYYPNVQDLLLSFDFSLCQCAYDGEQFVFGEFTLFDLARKKLVPGRIRYGVSSLRRVIKYAKQGYHICGGGLATLLSQVVADPSIINQDIVSID